jgi:predicted aminopeptidase
LLWVIMILHIAGCANTGYYVQAIFGQISILNKRQSIRHIIKNPNISKKLKAQLSLILELRDFAEKQLHLPVNDHYLTYVDLKRSYVLWNVFAAPEFSLTPKTWCYPVVGCMAYRGYFSKDQADHYSEKLKQQGFDTFVGGVSAYSTLGWLDDPVISTFVHRSPDQLAALIFHELAHQLLFIPNDTTFNESFATVIEQEGLRRWLAEKHDLQLFNDYQREYHRKEKFIQLVMKYKDKLASVFIQSITLSEKRILKADVFAQMKDEYRIIKQKWNGYEDYDIWFNDPLNNAKMITISTYYEFVPAFRTLLAYHGNNLDVFYRKCREVAQKPEKERQACLLRLLQG